MIPLSTARKLYPCIALLLAVTYFLFQVEPFEEEYLAQHRGPADELAFAKPSVNWETFDKSNAPKAFTVHPSIGIGLLHLVPARNESLDPFCRPFHPVRDKSPPPPLS